MYKKSVCIVGLGYVGLPLIKLFGNKLKDVAGIDNDKKKLQKLKKNISYVTDINSDDLIKINKKVLISNNYQIIKNYECIIICVPTPLTKTKKPNLNFIKSAIDAMLPYLRKNHIIILESTTYPGTTDDFIEKKINKYCTNLKIGVDIHIGYSPERINPGSAKKLESITKIVSSNNKKSLVKVNYYYSLIFNRTYKIVGTKVAEATKIYENIFRSVNIALVNELKVIFNKMDIDIWKVIKAAKTKPFGFMPFYPGPGLGGHCIPIDPFYLSWKVREYGLHTEFIELAGRINSEMPNYILSRLIETATTKGIELKSLKVLILGIAYKKNINDSRESPSIKIIELLNKLRVKVDYHDPMIRSIYLNRSKKLTSITFNRKNLKNYNCVLLTTDHDDVNYNYLNEFDGFILDTRNKLKESSNIIKT